MKQALGNNDRNVRHHAVWRKGLLAGSGTRAHKRGMPVLTLAELKSALPPKSCLLGLDYGSKVIGVAVSDPGLTIASPLLSLERSKLAADLLQLAAIVRDRDAGGIVLGLPVTMEGGAGPATQRVRAFAAHLMRAPDLAHLPVVLWDERFSTAAVERFMIEGDMTRRRRAQTIDKAAAAYILQGVLDALRF